MHPISVKIAHDGERIPEHIFGEEQPDYLQIPVVPLVHGQGRFTYLTRFTFTEEERAQIAAGADVFLGQPSADLATDAMKPIVASVGAEFWNVEDVSEPDQKSLVDRFSPFMGQFAQGELGREIETAVWPMIRGIQSKLPGLLVSVVARRLDTNALYDLCLSPGDTPGAVLRTMQRIERAQGGRLL